MPFRFCMLKDFVGDSFPSAGLPGNLACWYSRGCCSTFSLLGEAEERAFPPPTARTPKTQQVTAPAVATWGQLAWCPVCLPWKILLPTVGSCSSHPMNSFLLPNQPAQAFWWVGWSLGLKVSLGWTICTASLLGFHFNLSVRAGGWEGVLRDWLQGPQLTRPLRVR